MLAALLMVGAAFVSCEKENTTGKYTMTVKATKGGNGSKALSEDGASISATWAEGDEVQVYNGSTHLGTLTAQSAGETTTLRGNLSGSINENDVLTLKFLSPNYSAQDGTLTYIAANCDYAVATVTVTAIDGSNNISTNAPASFQNQQAIFKFTVKNSDGSATIDVTSLTVTTGGQDYVITPASATSELFAALPPISSQAVTFTATGSDSKTYTASKASVTFAAGNYYQSIIKLTEQAPAATGHALSASEVGEIVCSDGLAYAAADKDNLPTGVTAVAIVAYVGDAGSVDASSSTYKGLAIAISDANDGSSCGWGEYFVSYNCVSKSNDIATAIGYKDGISSTNTLTSDGHYHEAATAAASNNGTAAPTGTSGWFLPSMGQWNLIVQGLASKKAGSAVTTDISTSGNDTYTASNLNSVITDAGGTGFNGDYHSSTQYDSESCWHMNISSGRASDYNFYAGDYVRSVLAF